MIVTAHFPAPRYNPRKRAFMYNDDVASQRCLITKARIIGRPYKVSVDCRSERIAAEVTVAFEGAGAETVELT